MQRVMILASLQKSWNSTEQWLSWPSIRRSRRDPIVLVRVCWSKWRSHAIPWLFVVQPVSLTPIFQPGGGPIALIPLTEVGLAGKDDVGGYGHSRSPNSLDYRNPSPTSWLNQLWPAAPVGPSHHKL